MVLAQYFNSSLEIGNFLNTTTANVTGNEFITLIFILILIVTVAMLFHMPELLLAIVITPLMVVFGLADPSFGAITQLLFIIIGVLIAVRMILFR